MRRAIIAVAAIATIALIGAVALFIGAGNKAKQARAATPDFSLVGYATVNGTTTGGAGGPTVTVNTLSQLKADAGSSGPLIIQVNGAISGNDSVVVTSNKTIVGVGTSAVLTGIGFVLEGNVSNVILQNLTIARVTSTANGNDGDAIHIQGTGVNHIWIDHNDLSSQAGNSAYDGLLDITHGSDFITVSWNTFHDHDETSLIGHDDSNAAEDTGHFHVTYHHNFFTNVGSRAPSIRFGTLHSFDNYFLNFNGANTGISSRMGACSRIEDDYFNGVKTPILTTQSTSPGNVQLINDVFLNESSHATSPTCTLNVPYAYSNVLQDVSQVPTIVPQFAGVGKLSGGSPTATPVPPTPTFTPSAGTPTPTPTPRPGTPTLTPTTSPATATPTPSSGGNGITATGTVSNSGGFFGEEDVTVGNTATITALTVTVTLQKTTGVSFGGQYNTVGSQIAMTHTDNGTTIVYTFTLSSGQMLGAGTGKLFAAQYDGTGTAHSTSGDTWSVTATSNGSTSTLNGHF